MILEVKIPSPGESINEVIVSQWLKKDGDGIAQDENILEIESEKATLVLTAESAGKLNIKIQEGETVQVGAVVATIDTAAAISTLKTTRLDEKREPAPTKPEQSHNKENYSEGLPSISAEKIAREKDISLKEIKGSGKKGRITKQDLINQVKQPQPAVNQESSIEKAGIICKTSSRAIRVEKMSPLRRKIASRLVAVKNETAMLTTFNEVDMTLVMETRKKHKDSFFEKHGVKLGFMSFFTEAVIRSLELFPTLNAYIVGNEIEYHDYQDIGISVSGPKGLVVPVLRNAQLMSMAELEKQILYLATKARNLTLSIDEMTGGTFTITNGGVFGSLMSTPILNPPQSGILGMHNIVERPVAIQGEIKIRPMMYIALSYDHRLVDGKESVSFLLNIKKIIEDPVKLLLEV